MQGRNLHDGLHAPDDRVVRIVVAICAHAQRRLSSQVPKPSIILQAQTILPMQPLCWLVDERHSSARQAQALEEQKKQ